MGDLGFEPRTNGLRVRCATVALVTLLGKLLVKLFWQKLIFRKLFLEINTSMISKLMLASISGDFF